jgi:uncharacterized phage protein (TIGR02220 family)
MAKDPAVLFFPNDFIASTALWNNSDVGLYIRLLCYQHINDGIAPDDFAAQCAGSEKVMAKFRLHENGRYYNDRMLAETTKRKSYSESRRQNVASRYKKTLPFEDKQTPTYEPTYVDDMNLHMGNRNINSNNIPILESNTSLGEEKRGVGEEEERQRVIKSIVDYLNEKSGKRYRSDTQGTTKHINARLNEGYIYDDFVKVIDVKVKEWKGDKKFDKYLRPDTLFNSEKFPAYLNQKGEEDIVQAELEQWPGIIIV